MSEPWKNRIVGHADVDPGTLTAHDKNWRLHPAAQREALEGAIDEVGFLRSVTVNQRTGRILDGHLRVRIALDRGEPTVPVEYVDLSEDEEKLALLTLDPISALATADAQILEGLLRDVQTESEAVAGLLTKLAQESSIMPGDRNLAAQEPAPPEEFGQYGEDIEVEHICPKCGYAFSGGKTKQVAVKNENPG